MEKEIATAIKMEYTINESVLERQHLLSSVLDPMTLRAFEKISLPANAMIADIGCGIGDTTLMLHHRFPSAIITGLDGNASLINAAKIDKEARSSSMSFVCGNALELPFADNSFDMVFCRYILHHIDQSLSALEEMKRVCKPGGMLFIHEPDITGIDSFPENDAYPALCNLVNELFADGHIGRKLPGLFSALGLKEINLDTQALLADHKSALKKFYSMTIGSLKDAAIKRKLLTGQQVQELAIKLVSGEKDPNTVVLMHPTIAIWGIKQ